MPKPKPIPSVRYLHECFTYDPKTGVLRWKRRPRRHFTDERVYKLWNTRYAGRQVGCLASHGYRFISLDNSKYTAHRIIFKLMTGTEPITVDHRYGDRDNNRLIDLRSASYTNQSWNSQLKENSSGFRGVERNGKNWISRISKGNRNRQYLGTFATPQEASIAFKAAARKIQGEFYHGLRNRKRKR